MNSMTGYGSARAALGRLEVTVQASSVNRKTLDLAISVPEDWRSFEADIAERVRQRAARGRISLTVKAEFPGDSGGASIDADFVTAEGDLRTLPCHWPERGGIDGFYVARLRLRAA